MQNDRSSALFVIDFDGTITNQDAVDGLIGRFSISDQWKLMEEQWEMGQIGSAECMSQQLREIRVTEDELEQFLQEIQVDPSFQALQDTLANMNIPLMIMSDGFDLLIQSVLRRNHFEGLWVKCNHLEWRENRLIPQFPYIEDTCGHCAHCKQNSIQKLKRMFLDKRIIYAGDGRSDICATKEADYLFAKESLAEYCDKERIEYQKFCSLADIVEGLPKALEAIKSFQDQKE